MKMGAQFYITAGLISEKAFSQLNWRQRQNLGSENVRGLVVAGILSFDEARDLNDGQREALSDNEVFNLVVAKKLHWSLANIPIAQAYVDDGSIGRTELLALDWNQRQNLGSANVRELVTAGILSFDEAQDLSHDQREALNDNEVFQRAIAGNLPWKSANFLATPSGGRYNNFFEAMNRGTKYLDSDGNDRREAPKFR